MILKPIALVATAAVVAVNANCSGSGARSPSPAGEPDPAIDWSAAADRSSSALIAHYWDAQEQYFYYTDQGNPAFHYWPQAHALDLMLDAYSRTDDPQYKRYISQWYAGVYRKNGESFLNDYYDDMEWNALALLRAYRITGDERFRAAVDTIWREIKTGWTDVAGGGIMWSKGTPRSKNAISNAPASLLASRLYQLSGDPEYLEWARKTYAWQKIRLVDPTTGAVWDHVVADNGSERIRKDWTFAYNQGMYLAAALALYEITDSPTYLMDAIQSADYALENLTTSDRLLKDEGSGDGGLFKGIFVRYLTQLILEEDLPEPTRKRYAAFLKHNAETLWQEGTDKSRVLFGTYWKNRPRNNEEVDLTVQLSGAMLMEAAALLEKERPEEM